MADFSPDLDDGKLWLPSNIFLDVGVDCHWPESDHRSELACMEDLAQRLGTFGLVNPSPPYADPKPTPNLHPRLFGAAMRFGPLDREVCTDFVDPAGTRLTGSGGSGSTPVYHPNCGLPTLSTVEVSGHLSGRILQGPPGRGGPNRFLPVWVAGSGWESGGTGVFLPRVVDDDTKKKPSGRQPRQHARNAAAGKQQAMPFQASTEMGLPRDWTY